MNSSTRPNAVMVRSPCLAIKSSEFRAVLPRFRWRGKMAVNRGRMRRVATRCVKRPGLSAALPFRGCRRSGRPAQSERDSVVEQSPSLAILIRRFLAAGDALRKVHDECRDADRKIPSLWLTDSPTAEERNAHDKAQAEYDRLSRERNAARYAAIDLGYELLAELERRHATENAERLTRFLELLDSEYWESNESLTYWPSWKVALLRLAIRAESEDDQSNVPPGATTTATKGEQFGINGFLGGEALADALRVDPSQRKAFFQMLARKRQELGDDAWREVSDRRPNDPQFLYRADAPKLRDLASRYQRPKESA